MAQSKNKRKNGKVIKKADALNKRMRRMAGYDLKDLIICSCVDVKEVIDENTRNKLRPRSVVYDRKKEDVTTISPLQERAIKTQRWKWHIHFAIVCRKQNGEVYLWNEESVFTHTEVLLSEMNDYVSERLCDLFLECNSMHRLTMVWIAAPYDMENPPIQAVLAPLHYFNVLQNLMTDYEQNTPDHTVISYKASTLQQFAFWFIDQGHYRRELEMLRTVTFWFEETGNTMQKGQLQDYRKSIADVLKDIDVDPEPFNPFATPSGFVRYGKRSVVCKGVDFSRLMTALEKNPPCVNCSVEIKFADEAERWRDNQLKFVHGKEIKSYE